MAIPHTSLRAHFRINSNSTAMLRSAFQQVLNRLVVLMYTTSTTNSKPCKKSTANQLAVLCISQHASTKCVWTEGCRCSLQAFRPDSTLEPHPNLSNVAAWVVHGSSTASTQTARFCCAQHNKKEPEPDMQQHSHRWTTHPHTTSHRHMHAGAIAATTRCTSSNNSCPKTQQAWTTHLLRFVSQEVNLKSGSLVKLRAAKKHKQAFVQAWRCRDRGTACLLYIFPVAAGLEGSPESLPCCH